MRACRQGGGRGPCASLSTQARRCADLAALGMSAAELARRIKVPVKRITQILNGRRAVTGDTALRLVLVLGQVRFSPVRQMSDYIPAIQEEFRRHGFPIERAGKVQQLIFGPSGGVPVQVVEEQRWEYRTRGRNLEHPRDAELRRPADHSLWEVRGLRRQAPARRWNGPLEDRARPVSASSSAWDCGTSTWSGRATARISDSISVPASTVSPTKCFGRAPIDSTWRAPEETSVGDVPGTLIVRVVQNDQGVSLPSCIPSFCRRQITPKTSRYTRCSSSMLPNVSINGRTRSSGQLGRW